MNICHSVKHKIGTKLLLALMPAWLALTPLSVLAHDGASGARTGANINLTNTWRDIETTSVRLAGPGAGHTHYCTVVGSADALFVDDDDADASDNCRYEFGLRRNGGSIIARRTVELNDNPGVDDQNWIEVGSTAFFTVPIGDHTFRWMARKRPGTPAACAAQSDDASMTVNCFERRLPAPLPLGTENDLESAN